MIKVNIEKCTGCHRCEVACTFFHTGRTNRHHSRIKVLNLYETGIDGPIVCVQCQERYCMSCPEDALSIGKLGQIIVAPTVCTLCGVCEKRCPIGAIEIFSEVVHVCDLCGGNPRCVAACTEGAIVFEQAVTQPSLTAIKRATNRMNRSQRQQYYLSQQGMELRNQWRKKSA